MKKPQERCPSRLPFGFVAAMTFILLIVGRFAPHQSARAEDGRRGPTQLLAGQDAKGELAGWISFSEIDGTKTRDVWTLVDGTLICRGTPKGYLRTRRDYKNFVLRLEWRWPSDRNTGHGGVLIRMTGAQKIWPRSLEAQMNAGEAGDFWGLAGFPLGGPADRRESLEHPQFGKLIHVRKLKAVEKPPGEWNSYVIDARDGTVTLTVNGKRVNRAVKCATIAGPICLTAEGDEIHFRNVTIEER